MEHRLLLVSDSPALAGSLEALLAREGIAADVTGDKGAALEWLHSHRASVVIVPCARDDREAIQLLEEVHSLASSTRRLLLTERADLETLQSAINMGAIHYFVRLPWNEEELLATVDGAATRFIQRQRQESMAELVHHQHQELEALTSQLTTMVERRTRQLERAKREWERTFDAISSPLTQVGPGFELLRVNLAAAAQADKPVRQLPGTRCHESLFGRVEPCAGCPLVASSGGGRGDAEIVDERSGRVFRLSTYLFEEAGEQSKFVCNYKDITQEKQLQRAVVQSEKLAGIGQLAGGVAHELNNPIGVILSFTQFSKESAERLGDEELLDNLVEVESAAKRCKEIVAGLLDFSRPSVDLKQGLVNLNEVMEKAFFLVSTQRATRNLTAITEYDRELPLVIGNRNQLMQVFINLIQNAAQAMSGSGELRLKTEVGERGRAVCEVTDQGVGIPPEHLSRIFEPFFTTKAPGQGTGLGLSVTYGIIDAHGGVIKVDSKVGRGTTFKVVLPPAPAEE